VSRHANMVSTLWSSTLRIDETAGRVYIGHSTDITNGGSATGLQVGQNNLVANVDLARTPATAASAIGRLNWWSGTNCVVRLEGIGAGVDDAGYLEFKTKATGASLTTKLALGSDGVLDYKLARVAVGGGAGATLGTIGGSGPTAAAMAGWMRIQIAGTNHWVPVWT